MQNDEPKGSTRLCLRIKPGAAVTDSSGTTYVNQSSKNTARITIIRQKPKKEELCDKPKSSQQT